MADDIRIKVTREESLSDLQEQYVNIKNKLQQIEKEYNEIRQKCNVARKDFEAFKNAQKRAEDAGDKGLAENYKKQSNDYKTDIKKYVNALIEKSTNIKKLKSDLDVRLNEIIDNPEIKKAFDKRIAEENIKKYIENLKEENKKKLKIDEREKIIEKLDKSDIRNFVKDPKVNAFLYRNIAALDEKTKIKNELSKLGDKDDEKKKYLSQRLKYLDEQINTDKKNFELISDKKDIKWEDIETYCKLVNEYGRDDKIIDPMDPELSYVIDPNILIENEKNQILTEREENEKNINEYNTKLNDSKKIISEVKDDIVESKNAKKSSTSYDLLNDAYDRYKEPGENSTSDNSIEMEDNDSNSNVKKETDSNEIDDKKLEEEKNSLDLDIEYKAKTNTYYISYNDKKSGKRIRSSIPGMKLKSKGAKARFITTKLGKDRVKEICGNYDIKDVMKYADPKVFMILANKGSKENLAQKYVKNLMKNDWEEFEDPGFVLNYDLKGMKANKEKTKLSFFQRLKINKMAKKNSEKGLAGYRKDKKDNDWIELDESESLPLPKGNEDLDNRFGKLTPAEKNEYEKNKKLLEEEENKKRNAEISKIKVKKENEDKSKKEEEKKADDVEYLDL